MINLKIKFESNEIKNDTGFKDKYYYIVYFELMQKQ